MEKPEDKEIISVQEVDLDALFAETSSSLAKEAGEDAAEKAEEEPAVEEVTAEEIIGEPEEVVAEETVDTAGDVLEERVEGAVEIVTAETLTDAADEAMAAFEASLSGLSLDFAEETSSDAPETETSAESTEEPETEEDITGSEAAPMIEMEYPEETEETEPEIEDLDATRVIPDVTKQDAWHATPGDTQEFNLEEELKAALSGMDGLREQEEAERSASLDPEPETASEEEIAFEEKTEPMTEENTTEESVVEEGSETEAEEPEGDHIDKMLEEAEIQPDISEMTLERETPEEKRQRILNNTRPERLTAEQKQLFSYFAKVPGMDDQILDAIHGAYEYASEKTSHRGNIAIMGSHGTGKTRLSEGLVKAICKELGLKAVKYANLDASDINRKDPATIISKMAGGFLLIERASFMTPETVEKLSQAMDFRTDSMILLIEDDKANMRKMLADYPEFAEKFENVISIPVFTNDELVTFARTYARENGFRMDEMGVLALYTMIGDNQKEDEPITIGKVKEMVDGAIRKASGVKLGRKLSKRHTDADGRILLYEKDFDL